MKKKPNQAFLADLYDGDEIGSPSRERVFLPRSRVLCRRTLSVPYTWIVALGSLGPYRYSENSRPTNSVGIEYNMLILSLFSGCGGLDLGFEQAGCQVGLAYDSNATAIESWNHNHPQNPVARCKDIATISLKDMDRDFGKKFAPKGVVGGPPCQSFSRANTGRTDTDPRKLFVGVFVDLCLKLHRRHALNFIVMENVPELFTAEEGKLLKKQITRLKKEGFNVFVETLDASKFGVPQKRKRLFLVAIRDTFCEADKWSFPTGSPERLTVKQAIGSLPDPIQFDQISVVSNEGLHPNHWCMTPKSRRFFDGSLKEGDSSKRSFKTLGWNRPSITVSYGNREVHVHPTGRRRLSVYEGMLLQGFPSDYVLKGTLSSQFTQVSQAVPPPLAKSVAESILKLVVNSLGGKRPTKIAPRQIAARL